jgi:membrane fusion protein (multidrug efflux system)
VQYPAQLTQAKAQEQSAQANLVQTRAAYERQRAVDIRATSQQNIDTATAQQKSALANVAQAQAQVQTASLVPQQISQAQATVEERRQEVHQAEAQVEAAALNLSYTELRAPADGWVTKRNVQYGTFLQAGTSIFSLVTTTVWVTANFKESQLERMRPGDSVDVSIDAYPDLKLHGHVDSIQLGSGSRFSAFPAENATGNFVKIVQRVPVKILIDSGLQPDLPLPLGLSVVPKVMLK